MSHFPGGANGGNLILVHPNTLPSDVASLNALNAFTAVSDPFLRQMVDLRNASKVRFMASITGALVVASAVRLQYHIGGDPTVATGDAGWATLASSLGVHALNALFYTAEETVPAPARINHCLVRCGIWSGNGLVSPAISACVVNFYA